MSGNLKLFYEQNFLLGSFYRVLQLRYCKKEKMRKRFYSCYFLYTQIYIYIYFYILYIRSIVLLWSLVIRKRCITLEIAKDLDTLILPSKVNCLMRHNFKIILFWGYVRKIFYLGQDFYYTKNEHQVFSRFLY